MAYCKPDDVRQVLARDLDDLEGTAGEMLDEDLLEGQIVSAAGEVDARLAGRYRVPFADGQVPTLVRSLTIDVAAYLATLTYRQNKDLGTDQPVRLRYQRALDLLAALSKGDMDLPAVPTDDGGQTPTTAAAVTVRNPYEGRLFGMDDFELGYDGGRVRNRGW